jgi:hypothetical protein
MRTHPRSTTSVAVLLLAACHGDPDEIGSDASGDDSGEATTADADGGEVGTPGDDEVDDDEVGGEADESGAQFDVGNGDDSAGDGPPSSCVARECVDTSASAVVSLIPCKEWEATFFSPYDEHYQCWTAQPGGHLVGDTDVVFAAEDPDVLLLGRWDGGIAQLRVTRDASCNITGLASAGWESYAATEPDDVQVKGMTYLDDGTMVLLRTLQHSMPQLGQRGPGAVVTSDVVDLMTLLPAWPSSIYANNPAVGIAVVPIGFPGAGALKMLAETPDEARWFTVPLSANGAGGYDVAPAIEETQVHPPEDEWGGYYARGIAYIGVDNPEVDVASVFIPEAWQYIVSIYELDGDGNPLPDTRTPFVEGLGMPSGAERDPVSANNFVFTGRRSQSVYVIRGCEGAPTEDPQG